MSIIKHRWNVWKLNRREWFVLCERRNDGKSLLMLATEPDSVRVLNPQEDMPDIRLYYPSAFDKVPVICRAVIRQIVSEVDKHVWL